MSALEELEGASSWDQQIYGAFRAHVEEEDRLLAEYAKLSGDLDDPDVAYLVDLILEDEQRHHRVFEQLASTIRSDALFGPRDDAVPDVPVRRADPRRLLDVTRALLKVEREDARRLRRLQRDLKPVSGTTLWPLLVETMRLDTRKHIVILEHLREIARGIDL